MKKKIVISIIVVVCIVLGIFLYKNIKGPISAKSCFVRICYMSEDYNGSVQEYKQIYENREEDNLIQKIRQKNIFPSNNIKDYVDVGLFFELKNNSFLDACDITGYLLIDDEDSVIISKEGSQIIESLNGGEQNNIFLMGLLIYKGDMSDEDIVEYIHSLDIEVFYKNKFMSHLSKTIHLSDLSIESDIVDWDEQRGE